MIGIAVFLVVVGGCDLLRAVRDVTTRRVRWGLTGLGFFAVIGAAVWIDAPRSGWWAWFVAAVSVALWINLSAISVAKRIDMTNVHAGSGGRPGLAAAAALALGAGAMVLVGGYAGDLPSLGVHAWVNPPVANYDEALLFAGLMLVQLSTANLLVRMLLNGAGVPAVINEKEVKGGRLLGPMERIFILTLGAAGQFTAASAVVAAKALLRFPESRDSTGKDSEELADRTEYMLLGSLASWLFALASIGATSVYL